MIVMAIKIHLDDILKERNMTSKELCKKVHITEANLSILRSGKAKGVRFSTINKICYYLECDVGDILKFDGLRYNVDLDCLQTLCESGSTCRPTIYGKSGIDQ